MSARFLYTVVGRHAATCLFPCCAISRAVQVNGMMTDRNMLAAFTAALISVCSGSLYADTVGAPIDLSANVFESILPGGAIFHDSKPLFGTTLDPKQSAELLHLSQTGVNASGRSTNISDAFASSLAESDGNGGVGVSQLIFGSPGGSGQNYTGIPAAEVTLHLHIPALQVGLLGVPPRRTGPSATETARSSAKVDSVVTHPDGSGERATFEIGLLEFEEQIPSGRDLLNLGSVKLLGQTGQFAKSVKFNGDDFNPSYTIDPLLFDVILPQLRTGDTMSWVYTLTAQGTTHGFERGYGAFIGDPFGVNVITDNLTFTVALQACPKRARLHSC